MPNIDTYREMLAQPWGKIQYEITLAQLAHIKGLNILDFGAGFGIVSQFLSKHNTVTAVEPNAEMLFADEAQTFTKILGSLEKLDNIADETFDLICCHNVLEYIAPDERPLYLNAFRRLLKPGGQLSIIKHNTVGKVLQSVVFSNDVDTALQLLKGGDFKSLSFAQGKTYDIAELVEISQLALEDYQGIRTFYSLQPNTFKTEADWLEKMTTIELAVCNEKPYKDISFLQHVWLRKEENECLSVKN
ncbi:class I SAM-dependent methyltransferase [Streptococcus caprae]|uniref:Class I SAM-dependent methyltransferase n=1 Tax=Streptococcus caprae TaxID=1640501 RepID=A0ABV8CW91_9STRE